MRLRLPQRQTEWAPEIRVGFRKAGPVADRVLSVAAALTRTRWVSTVSWVCPVSHPALTLPFSHLLLRRRRRQAPVSKRLMTSRFSG
jgi:hypothetical protein